MTICHKLPPGTPILGGFEGMSLLHFIWKQLRPYAPLSKFGRKNLEKPLDNFMDF